MRIPLVIKNLAVLTLLLLKLGMGQSLAQVSHSDTLRLDVYFQKNVFEIDENFLDNGVRMRSFRDMVDSRIREGCVVDSVLLRGSSSPEGSSQYNKTLAYKRAHALDSWLADTIGLRSALYRYEVVGEDWNGLARIIRTLDVPWRDSALDIIEKMTDGVNGNDKVLELGKNRLRGIEEGRAWKWLETNVFPELRSMDVSVECIISAPVPARTDTIFVTQTIRDTVYIDVTPPEPGELKPSGPDYSDRRMLFALRTNVLAIPFANFGIEVPVGHRWSIGADLYYPWIWRPDHAAGKDRDGVCNELMASDVELRYWFPRRNQSDGQRLLGHSVGIYGAAGQYDFERDWSGLQGELYDFGLDYLYAAPLFRGRMHFEAEIGFGLIWSTARPYDCLEPGGVIYHKKGVTQNTTWVGPTRAQLSLVVPIYARKKGGGR